jgi:tetratricopeptide (TPR) repeat protein/TolB-like protein/predicted Ser/Thr protein kinase
VNPGDVISRYRIIARIGKGGMGVVYRAEDTRLERQVALKFLPHEGFTEQSKIRFLNEARIAAKARHPNICPIHDIEEVDGELFLVMAYIEGETLQRRISRGPLDPSDVIHLAAQVASGLACAHALGIIHRDIKSGNIMVDRAGQASILDFGLALAPAAVRLTDAGSSVGTPAYMSPEQIEGRPLDARTDLWSLGVVMFEMLTGVLPFCRDQSAAIIHSVLHDSHPEISSLRTGVPRELQRIVEKALVKDPARRWQTASEMLTELNRLGGTGAVSVPDELATQTMKMPSTRIAPRRRVRFAVIVVAVLLASAGRVALYRARKVKPPAKPAIARVAVLPFQAAGADTATGSVADGLSEILAAALSGYDHSPAGLIAVAPSDLRASHVANPQEAHRLYGVNLAITGAARKSGDQIEFTVNLIDAVTLRQIAARTFIYDPKNPLVSRDQAVTQVAGMMNLSVPPAVHSLVTAGDTGAPSAYSAYIEGRGFLARHDLPGNVSRAIDSFTTATHQDPKFALAYAGLAEAYWRQANGTGDKLSATLANQNAEYAVQLDGSRAGPHEVLGSVYLNAGRQQDAIREFQRALELAPSDAVAARKLAEVYQMLGRFDEAESLYVSSTKSRPTDWYGYLLLGVFYYERERYPEAEAALNEAKTLTPDNDLVRQDLAGIYRQHGKYKEAIEEYQKTLQIRNSAATYAGLGGAYYYEHRFQEAVSAVEAAIDLNSNEYRYWGNLGIYCRWAPGNEAKSAPALHRAIELAGKVAETVKSDYSVHANLAEYRARLGDAKGALGEIESIPLSARRPFTTRLAIVYELTGHRDLAVQVIRSNLKTSASLNQIKDDPDLAALWRESKLQ